MYILQEIFLKKQKNKRVKILFISDTHELHRTMYSVEEAVATEEIDLIIHCGDGANHRNPHMNLNPMLDCLTWLNSLGPQVIYCPGNHDVSIEKDLIHLSQFKNVDIVIHDSITFQTGNEDFIKIFCSPYTPTFGQGWAWNIKRQKIDNVWKDIPEDTDILVTHGPPYGILDKTGYEGKMIEAVGCKSLLNHVHRVKPKIHAFGHVHDEKGCYNHGIFKLWNTTFINASMVNLKQTEVNNCIIYEI